MKMTKEKIIDYFVPNHLDDYKLLMGTSTYEKIRFTITMFLCFILITFSFGILHLVLEGFGPKFQSQFFTCSLLIVSLFFFKYFPKVRVSMMIPFLVSMIHLPMKYAQHGTILSPTPIWFIVIPPICYYLTGMKVGVLSGLLYVVEFIAVSFFIKNGESFTTTEFVMMGSVILGAGLFVYFVHILELTQRRWDQDIKERLIQETQTAHLVSLGEMAGNLAHEINNPLAIIQGNLQSLQKKESLQDEQAQKRIEKALVNTARVNEIVTTLTAVAKKNFSDEVKHFGAHFSKSLNQFLSLFQETLKENGIELRFEKSDLGIVIPCDPDVLTKALLGLARNSVEAVKGSKNPYIQIKVETLPMKTILYFIDSGKGLTKEQAVRIFEPFFTTKDQGEGLGIGLSLMKNELLEQKAILSYDYRATNTTFKIEFPAV